MLPHTAARLTGSLLILPALTGCFSRLHVTQPIEVEVFDALSGEPIVGGTVSQGAPVGFFERSLHEEAVTDANGVAHLRVIRLVDDSWWQLSRDTACDPELSGPFYDGVGLSQIPSEFTEVSTPSSVRRYRAPLWPHMWLSIELPAEFRGPLSWHVLSCDAASSSGWIPPAQLASSKTDPTVHFSARATPDANGAVAHPTTIGGVRGFGFHNYNGDASAGVFLGGVLLRRISATSEPYDLERVEEATATPSGHWKRIPMKPETVHAWELRAHHVTGAPPSWPTVRYAWFIGSRDELRAWLRTNSLNPVNSWGFTQKTEDPTDQRVYAASALAGVMPEAKEVSPAPLWTLTKME